MAVAVAVAVAVVVVAVAVAIRHTIVFNGYPGMSVWRSPPDDAASMAFASHHRAPGVDFKSLANYKISGDFIPNSPYFAAADSLGRMVVVEM